MKTTNEFDAIRAAMGRRTKKQFRDGVDTMAKAAVYLKVLEQMELLPSSLFDDYIKFATLLVLIDRRV